MDFTTRWNLIFTEDFEGTFKRFLSLFIPDETEIKEKERQKEWSKHYYLKHREKLLEKQKELTKNGKRKKYDKKYYQSELYKATKDRYLAKKKGVTLEEYLKAREERNKKQEAKI